VRGRLLGLCCTDVRLGSDLAPLSRGRYDSELLEKAQRIHHNPLLRDLVAGRTEDLRRLECDLTASRRYAQERAPVRAPHARRAATRSSWTMSCSIRRWRSGKALTTPAMNSSSASGPSTSGKLASCPCQGYVRAPATSVIACRRSIPQSCLGSPHDLIVALSGGLGDELAADLSRAVSTGVQRRPVVNRDGCHSRCHSGPRLGACKGRARSVGRNLVPSWVPEFGHRALSAITAAHVEAAHDYGRRPVPVRRCGGDVNCPLYRVAMKLGELSANPMSTAERARDRYSAR
jgi:hypothetical protein